MIKIEKQLHVMSESEGILMFHENRKMAGYEKMMLAARIVLSVVIITLAALQLLDIWEDAIDWCIPLLGVLELIQAAGEWKRNRGAAMLSLGVAVFILGAFIAVHFVL